MTATGTQQADRLVRLIPDLREGRVPAVTGHALAAALDTVERRQKVTADLLRLWSLIDPDRKLSALKQAGCQRIFTDKATEAHLQRPELAKCLKEGDTLTVWKLDRLGRSLRDLIGLLDDLKARGAAFRSLTEAIDTTTPTCRALWQMVGILAELERSLIQERTQAGRAAAVARGVKMGRKPKLSPQQVAHARTLIGQGEPHDTVAESLSVSRRTLYRALQK